MLELLADLEQEGGGVDRVALLAVTIPGLSDPGECLARLGLEGLIESRSTRPGGRQLLFVTDAGRWVLEPQNSA